MAKQPNLQNAESPSLRPLVLDLGGVGSVRPGPFTSEGGGGGVGARVVNPNPNPPSSAVYIYIRP